MQARGQVGEALTCCVVVQPDKVNTQHLLAGVPDLNVGIAGNRALCRVLVRCQKARRPANDRGQKGANARYARTDEIGDR